MDTERANSRIHVCARLRPLIAEDYKLGNVVRSAPERCVHLGKDGQTVKLTKDTFDAKVYRVDHTFNEGSSQTDVYAQSFKRIVMDAVNGYNGTGMVYGQTGSGKSHTMFGNDKDPGLVQLSINDVFQEVRLRIAKDLVANVFVSFYQLYLEQAYDLLVTPSSSKATVRQSQQQPGCVALGVREDAVKGTFVENLQYIYVDDEASTMDVLRQGLRNRKVHSTTYNMSSSRSHAIFQMYLDFEERGEEASNPSANDLVTTVNGMEDGATKKFSVRRRVLTFVDLAGSERVQTHHQAKSKAQHMESVAINKSISALGNCIQALAAMSQQQLEEAETAASGFPTYSSSRISHVPFRDSKLTRLLAEPLGGNSKTCIIVNIGPCAYNIEETTSTLKFARRAMTIRKRVKKGEIEQLQVQDVLSEDVGSPHEPTPPRVSLGGKKVTSLKLARIVVRDSPEERLPVRHRYAESEFDPAQSMEFGEEREEIEEYAGTLSRSNSGYFLHVPAGSAFNQIGVDAGPAAPSVRLNLGDFLRACQAGGVLGTGTGQQQQQQPSTPGRYTSISAVIPVAEAATVPGQRPSLQRTPSGNSVTFRAINPYVTDQFLEDMPPVAPAGQIHAAAAVDAAATLTLDTDFSPIPASSSGSYASPFTTTGASSAVSLSWPASMMSPPPVALTRGAESLTEPELESDPEPVKLRPPSVAPNILLPSPHPNLDNVPPLLHSDTSFSSEVGSPNASTISALSPNTPSAGPVRMSMTVGDNKHSGHRSAPTIAQSAVESVRKQRRFVWERGSGDVNNTVEITPIVSRYRGRGSDVVAAVASVPTLSPHVPSTHGADGNTSTLENSNKVRPISPSRLAGKKVTGYIKYAPAPGDLAASSADPEQDLPDPTLVPAPPGTPPWRAGSSPIKPSKSPQPTRKPSLSMAAGGAVRDETNSMPRSTPPKPTATPSPLPLHVPVKHPSVGSTGPYNFHRKNPAPTISKAHVTPKKKSVKWGDKKVDSTPSNETKSSSEKKASPMLASTMRPFERNGYSSPHSARTVTLEEVTNKLDSLERSAAASAESKEQGPEAGKEVHSTPQTALVKLVQELRDELQRKDAEISSLRNFILNN